MPDEFEIGDRVLLTTDDAQVPAVVVAKVCWSDHFWPPITYKVTVFGTVAEATGAQLERMQ